MDYQQWENHGQRKENHGQRYNWCHIEVHGLCKIYVGSGKLGQSNIPKATEGETIKI